MIDFDATPPALSLDALADLAQRHFGLSGALTPLASERDQNARLDTGSASYVVKLANAAEDPAHLEMQNAALAHIEACGITGTPRLVPTLSGAPMETVSHEGASHALRVVTWLSGPLLSGAPRSTPQLRSLGAFMGRLTRALQGFGHKAAHRPDFVWSLDHVARLRPWADEIAEAADRARVIALFDRYEDQVAPRLPALRASVLHQDANDNNVIVDADDPDRVTGLIDFGDMAFGRTVNELAITLAYALLDAEDLYTAMRAVIEGYVAEFPLTAPEADVLFDLMRMRLVASVCISSHQIKAHPGNDYLLVSQKPAFALLDRLDRIDPAFMTALCRKAAGHDAVPTAPAIRADLAARPPAPLCPPSLRRAARMALLMDGTYPDMPAYSDRAFDDWLGTHRPESLPDNVPFYGMGPYGEVRSVYTSEQFADAASPERRTRHMGIDVFGPAGTPVLAPLDGRVRRATYNADPLDYGNLLILEHETADGLPFFTLYGHLAGEGLATEGATVRAGDTIARFGDWHENGGWSPHLHFQVMSTMLSQSDNFFGVGHDSHWDIWSDICLDPLPLLGLTPETFTVDPNPPEALMRRRADHLSPALSVSYRNKLKIVRGRGPWLIDHTGRHFLDAVNNITHVGHCHPHVVNALAAQAATLNTNTRYLGEPILDYSERLAARLPEGLDTLFFVNSGSEANELALRIARTALGRKNTVVLDWAYHGNTGGMVDVSPYKFKRKGGFPKPDFVEIAEFPDAYRGTHRGMTQETATAYAADVARCLDDIEAATGSGAASFIAESVSGVGGQVFYPPGYLEAAYAHVRARGGVCIADEVQCGFGRMGDAFWAFETQGVTPDIVVMGKPIGNGHPLAAVATTRALAEKFRTGMEYFNSFGGNPVSMAVGMAVLDVIESEDLQARARATGDHLMACFRDLATRHPLIGDVRGRGLFCGIELVRDADTRAPATDAATAIVNDLREQGVLLSTDGPDENVLKLKPPMVFGIPEADIVLDALEAAFRRA
ncbi:aminotransferase class III-fold pyridoxal phosphate-dependent enzyme [Roseovarius sp. SCSIO 43702]|uniref:aminotransferase class III-fold pyridoxal phosphate-dependent enzyme n=1 Tax=Roseovarius sp. SCSIO 43702 TaxID=2823043 RepID=UPI001C73B63E|nr:aminotransferase class III-fold pyridoxal phosphate-dependent enzyme [Roseovarius sp. SCSIO 43702]QYX55752.1 aminotransferase class III-fold pyridoxal phosphate-dependent enzyme [Roseovarius sp. SCSIO 43702]